MRDRREVDQILNSKGIKILDGSFSDQLSKHYGKSLDGDPLWGSKALVTNPEAVIKVHIDYLKAGSDIIETNTYQASILGFMRYLNLSEEESCNLIKKAVRLAQEAIDRCKTEGILGDRQPLIAGSMGSYGAYLHDGSEYNGQYTDFVKEEELRDYHKDKMKALIEGGADLLAIETIPSRKEAEVLVKLLKEHPQMKAWLSFSCQTDGKSLVHGDDFRETARYCFDLSPNQIIAVGVNCLQPSAVADLFKGIQDNRTSSIPLIVYANSGERYDPNSGWDNHSEILEPYIPIWLDLGVKYIGGCCRVCSNYVVKIKEEVAKWEFSKNK